MTNVAILGSTGTIGRNTLEVIRRHRDRFKLTALAAGSNIRLLEEQIREFKPAWVSVEKKADADHLRALFGKRRLGVVYGPEGAEDVGGNDASEIVVSAITGISGLRPTLAAVRAGKRVALANKESMVVGGGLLRREAVKSGASIIPVDSEHSGVFQCLHGRAGDDVARVTLTASGGPFFRTPLAELKKKSVAEALAHPRWKMGRKVTVDSATMMNKGLELIEARWLFDLPPEKLGILIHPQSIVHALVEMRDGSVLAQLSATDMKIPIQYALTYPGRLEGVVPPLDLARVRSLEFYPLEEARYPLVRVAARALREGESHPVALNAANELAVEAFLSGEIGFTAIAEVVARVLDGHRPCRVRGLEDIDAADRGARQAARAILRKRKGH